MPGPHGLAVRSNPYLPKGSPGYGAVVLRAVVRSRENSPCEHTRADAAASTASPPAFVTIAIRPSCRERTGRAGSADLPDRLSGILPVALFCRSQDVVGAGRSMPFGVQNRPRKVETKAQH